MCGAPMAGPGRANGAEARRRGECPAWPSRGDVICGARGSASCPGRLPVVHGRLARPPPQATRALFDPPPFQPEKLTVTLAPGTTPLQPCPPHRNRKYTLTHNDITGSLQLSIGPDYNQQQISGFYTRLLRDEVTAEWRCGGPAGRCSLHVQCHVSGEEMWLAPPLLRNYIFRREMPLVRGNASTPAQRGKGGGEGGRPFAVRDATRHMCPK